LTIRVLISTLITLPIQLEAGTKTNVAQLYQGYRASNNIH